MIKASSVSPSDCPFASLSTHRPYEKMLPHYHYDLPSRVQIKMLGKKNIVYS